MDLRSGRAYWPINSGLLSVYPPLSEDARCEVVVIGAGITGSLIAHQLVQQGLDVVMIDARDIGHGSTGASTALLQYEIDTPLSELMTMIGQENAVRAYRLGLEAIDKLEQLIRTIGDDCGFERKKSLYFASSRRDVRKLQNEYECQRRFGFDVEYLDQAALREISSLDAPAALYSSGDAQVDPYRLTHALLRSMTSAGARVFDRTQVKTIQHENDGVMIQTDRGFAVRAKHAVFATGYESREIIRERSKRDLGRLLSSFVFISEPIDDWQGWPDQALIWESARPYIYMRVADGRAIVGGEDVPYATAHRQQALLDRKVAALERRVQKLFPNINFEVAYRWAGTFGETKDGLAYIGDLPEFPHCHFALGYGGNGITYSVIAADVIAQACLGRTHPDAHLYRFDRS
jgi:glycine/D-amino acid oxidase-like deaminating enzyme